VKRTRGRMRSESAFMAANATCLTHVSPINAGFYTKRRCLRVYRADGSILMSPGKPCGWIRCAFSLRLRWLHGRGQARARPQQQHYLLQSSWPQMLENLQGFIDLTDRCRLSDDRRAMATASSIDAALQKAGLSEIDVGAHAMCAN